MISKTLGFTSLLPKMDSFNIEDHAVIIQLHMDTMYVFAKYGSGPKNETI